MEKIKLGLTAMMCLFAILSCICWVKSATASAEVKEAKDGKPGTILVFYDEAGSIDVIATAKVQARWNRWAAAFAAVAALAQAVLALVS